MWAEDVAAVITLRKKQQQKKNRDPSVTLLCIWLTSHSFISRKVHSHKSKVTLLVLSLVLVIRLSCFGSPKYCMFTCLHTFARIDLDDTCMQQTRRAGERCHEMLSSVVQVTSKMHYIAYYWLPFF